MRSRSDAPAMWSRRTHAPWPQPKRCVKVTALSSDGRKTLGEGTLKLVDNQVDVASGTIKLKAVFDNPGTALWPGLSVATRLLVRTLDNVVVVPDSAVQRGPNGLYAYLVTAASKAEMQPVKISMTQGGQSLVGVDPLAE